MRDAFNAARAAGTNLAFLGSNAAYWQVRYETAERTIVGYKEAAPDPEPNPALRTVQFRQLTPPRPECALMGVMFLRLREHQSGPVDYTVTNAAQNDSWFSGTGLNPGDKVLDIVGNEWDSRPDPPVPSSCQKPNLKVLFHFEGEPADADAVRYTATSGARVFAGGAQQLSWALDNFNLVRFGRTLPPDERFRRFMRNALTALGRPARPTALHVSVRGRTVTLIVTAHADPRIKLQTFKHAGGGPFGLGDAGVVPLCKNKTGNCVIRNVAPGSYRYAAVTVDEWDRSVPLLSGKVVVPPPA
jgi:N,N-dimethylformamidase beta subunit-like protein